MMALWSHLSSIGWKRPQTKVTWFLYWAPGINFVKLSGSFYHTYAEVNISTHPEWRHSDNFFSSCWNIQFIVFRAEIFKIRVYCAEILFSHACYMLHGHHFWLFGFDHSLWNASPKAMENEAKRWIKFFLFRVCAEILLSRVISTRDSCAGPLLGVVQKY